MTAEWVLLMLGGVAAGLVNTLAGGGSLLTVPLLVMVGLTPNVANGTNRIAVLVQTVVASTTFQKKGVKGIGLGLRLLPSGAAGAVVGTLAAIWISNELFRQIFGVAMIPLALVVFFRKKGRGLASAGDVSVPKLAVAYFFVGVYAGFIQAGVGMLALAALSILGGCDLRVGNAVKVFTIGVLATISVVMFAVAGALSWRHGLILSVGTGLGGYLGSIAVIERGDRWIRVAFLIGAMGLSFRMVFG